MCLWFLVNQMHECALLWKTQVMFVNQNVPKVVFFLLVSKGMEEMRIKARTCPYF